MEISMVKKTSTEPPLAQSFTGAPHTHTHTHARTHARTHPHPHTSSSHHTTPSPPSPKQVQEVHELDLFQFGYSQSNHYKRNINKIFYILIEPQLLPCTPAGSYIFHALVVYLQLNMCGGAFLRK